MKAILEDLRSLRRTATDLNGTSRKLIRASLCQTENVAKTVLIATSESVYPPSEIIGVADALGDAFLPRPNANRRAVLTLIPSLRSIVRHDSRDARRAAIIVVSTATRGLPMRAPFALAFFIPALTRSRISSRSYSAIAPMIWNISRPLAVLKS